MPVSKPQDLPRGGGGRWPICGSGFRSAQWGDLEVGYTETEAGDHTPLYQGLPGDVCPCPHYGYMLKGRLRCRYPGSDWPDEVAEQGDVYFFRSGHVLVYEEPSDVIEFNPASALQYMMDHIERAAGRLADPG